jgi:hypothetical protein
MNNCGYTLEELLPVTAKLTEKFTSKESTSVTYERARQLMEAAGYCISHVETDHQLTGTSKLSAMEAYEIGYENVVAKFGKHRKYTTR